MINPSFLAFAVDAFRASPPIFVVRSPDGKCREFDLRELCTYPNAIVTYDIDALLDVCRDEGVYPAAYFVDIGQALKLRSGLSREQGGERLWSMWQLLTSSPLRQNDLALLEGLNKGRVVWPDHAELARLLGKLTFSMGMLWRLITEDLSEKGEIERLEKIEAPVQRIFHHRYWAGIAIDRNAALKAVNAVRTDKYRAFLAVARCLNLSPATLGYRSISPFLHKTDASHLAEIATDDRLERRFKIAATSSKFAKSFSDYVHARRALPTLLQLVSIDRAFPHFDCFGTVTGRIVMRQPNMQQLRRLERAMISADPGKKLAYFDYAQFEPGVLAFLSADQKLVEAYNNSDLYSELSRRIYGKEDSRALCKRIFLAFSYGMEVADLARLVAGPDALLPERNAYFAKIRDFFDEFPGLSDFKHVMEHKFLTEGYISSLMGNRRTRRSFRDTLSAKERRWAVNHPVQGTASLVFKSALLSLADHFGVGSILIPMHDAILLQFDSKDGNSREINETVERLMAAAFEKWCPGIRPKICRAEFAPA
jgi:DNA polymerase-1